MRILRRIRRIAGTASVAAELSGRLAFLRALEGEPDLRSRALVLQQVARLLLRIHSIEVRESGKPPCGPALIVSNHVSYLDPLVILASSPALPVAKSEVRRWPLIGPLAARSGVQFVERTRASSGASILRTMARALGAGASVLNFPEGTTTEGARVLPLKPACFAAARMAKVPVVPVAIAWESPGLSWTGDESFLPHYLDVAGRERISVRLRWSAALADAGERELARQAHEFLAQSIREAPRATAECV